MGQQSVLPPLTNYSLQAVRQVVDDSNHDMVNMMTQQIGNAINPLINHTNNSNQQLATQMGRIADFFGGPQPQIRPLPIIQHVEVNPNEGIPNIGGIANNPIQQQPIVQQKLMTRVYSSVLESFPLFSLAFWCHFLYCSCIFMHKA